MKTTQVWYHGNCPDGCGAAAAAYLNLGEEAEYRAVSYGQPPPAVEPGGRVYIVDFSYPRAVLEQLRERLAGGELVVLDHHATAKDDLAGVAGCHFDMNKSGAVLAWEYFHPDPVPPLLRYLQDRDLWRFELPQSREVSAAVGSYPLDFRVFANWIREEVLMADLAEEGAVCLRLKNQQVQNMVKNHRIASLDVKNRAIKFYRAEGPHCFAICPDLWFCPVSNASVFFSEVGEALLKLYPEAPFAAYYLDRGDGKQQWGLRSRPDFDCSVIAKAFGGGGHKQASGFVVQSGELLSGE